MLFFGGGCVKTKGLTQKLGAFVDVVHDLAQGEDRVSSDG
jgi:hypothetical protein